MRPTGFAWIAVVFATAFLLVASRIDLRVARAAPATIDKTATDAERLRLGAATFLMGSSPGEGADDEHPQRAVAMSPFKLDRHEVTNARYATCVAAGACKAPALASSNLRKHYFDAPQYRDYPVIFVNWSQADTFCRWAGGRLPTEAEWEFAARGPAPAARRYPWGDELPDCAHANMAGCTGDTDRVGARPLGASPSGAQDMAGNVWEWTQDWYSARYYETAPAADPPGPQAGSLKVMRGGCWMSGPDSLRVSCRKAELPSTWAPNVGFRCAYPDAR